MKKCTSTTVHYTVLNTRDAVLYLLLDAVSLGLAGCNREGRGEYYSTLAEQVLLLYCTVEFFIKQAPQVKGSEGVLCCTIAFVHLLCGH